MVPAFVNPLETRPSALASPRRPPNQGFFPLPEAPALESSSRSKRTASPRTARRGKRPGTPPPLSSPPLAPPPLASPPKSPGADSERAASAPPRRRASVSKASAAPSSAEPPSAADGNSAKSLWKSAKDGALLKEAAESPAILPLSTIQAYCDELLQRAAAQEARLSEKGVRSLPVDLGNYLAGRAAADTTNDHDRFVDNLVREWDPNRDGSISLMEFRANLKKLLPKSDVKDIDALFESLDLDR